MQFVVVTLALFHSSFVLSANQFHEDLSPEERLHYFGTEVIEEVPPYHYTNPQPIDRRRRSSDDRADLEYLVDIFGEEVHLILKKNRHLITPGCVVEHHKANGIKEVYPCKNEIDCFYTGRTTNQSNSWVSASVCGGFHGIIGSVDGTFVVQPVRTKHVPLVRRDTDIRVAHIVFAHKDRRSNDKDDNSEDSSQYRKFRTRRSAARKYIETAVVVEPEVYKFHGQETERFVKTVMNVAAERFLDPSLQAQLYMTLNKLKILEQNEAGLTLDKDSTVTLNSFCQWQSTWNPKDDSNSEHADYVLLLTKLDLEHDGNKANSGLARKGMCGEKTKCSVNEDSGLGTGLTIAHETGHVLGMNHDGSGNSCVDFKNIMASSAATGPDALKWSQCSADALKQALRTSELNCLNDQPPGTADKSYETNTKPGTIFTANYQCRLMLGETAELCPDVHANGQDVCGGIVCRDKPGNGVNGCVIYAAPRMDGTDCGNRKWCIQGRCVAMGPGSPGPVNGGWSGWDTHMSPCSRSCGGGVRIKRRRCNNPDPQYGGRQCTGSDVVAEMCNVQPCSTSQRNFQEEQCSATDSEPIQGHTYHWVPNPGALGDDSCKINCQASGTNWFSSRGVNADGTECISDQPSTFSRCVRGKCKIFGCDGHMDSGKMFDQCGICNGGGTSCTKVSGNFNGGTAKVFTTFVHIPTGSTGITITQGNTYCFLNVKINGHNLFTASAPRSSGTFSVDGIIVKYNKNPERINIVGPTDKYIQAQVYRQYGPPYVGVDPDIYYEYHTAKSGSSTPVYMWKTQAGTCSKQCGTGTQVPTVTCVNQNSGTVADHFCNIYDKPKEEVHQCNTQACPPRWRTGNWAVCSRTCGGGNKHRTVECVEENNNVEKVLPSARCHGIAKPSESLQCNTNTCPGVWKTGTWSACSETCARGTRTRDVKCYSSTSSSTPVSDNQCTGAQKPAATEYCVIKPCRTDISGSSCTDKTANCFESYGEDVCNGQYKSWARDNCMKSCGVCSYNPTDSNPNCKDVLDNCAQYQAGFCTNSAYAAWAKSNCKRHCGYCGAQATTTTVAPANPNCMDKESNCKDYGSSVCTQYAPWSKEHCKQFCGMCELTQQDAEDETVCIDTADCAAYGTSICSHKEFAQSHCRKTCGLCAGCANKKDNCESYGASVCTQYKPWATENCKGFCNLCGSRKKRDLAEMVPLLADEPPLDKLKLLDDEIPIQVLEHADDSFEETESLERDLDTLALEKRKEQIILEDDEFKIPPRPVCNTVLTKAMDSIDVTGKLLPGELCEQTIALSLNSRVSLKFDDVIMDCESGDTLTVTDGMTNIETDICRNSQDSVWVSAGSIAIIKFISSTTGHGYSFSYESLPQNMSVSECSQHLTSASGEVEIIRFPASYRATNDRCEIYITGSPGKNVQFMFNDFKMSGDKTNCSDGEGVLVEDLVGGETDRFCGDLPAFMWESQGSRVRLVYSQVDMKSGFSALYSVQNV